MTDSQFRDAETFVAWIQPEDGQTKVTVHDWQILQLHASKITSLSVDIVLDTQFVAKIQHLLAAFDQTVLCANLSSLQIDGVGDYPNLQDTVSILAGPALRVFRASGKIMGSEVPEDDETIHRFEAIQDLAPYISKVTVALRANDFILSPDYSMFTHLRELCIHGVVWKKGWESLSQCPALETLVIQEAISLRPEMDGQDHDQNIGPASYTLPQLRYASIAGFGGDVEVDAAELLSVSEMPELRHLKTNITNRRAYDELIPQLGESSPHLQGLHLTIASSLLPLGCTIQRNLSRLVGLRSLVLGSGMGHVRIDDTALGQIGSSLPELKELRVDNTPPNGVQLCYPSHISKISPRGLMLLSAACRGLEDLTVSVGDRDDICSSTLPRGKSCLPALRKLKFHHLEIKQEALGACAEWFAAFCPGLDHLEVSCLLPNDHASARKDVVYGFVSSFFLEKEKMLCQWVTQYSGVGGVPSSQ